jgi:predicted O-linked N-acetylglucosamine transferase (SPINDLY family)
MTALAARALEQLAASDPAGALATLATPISASEYAVLGMTHLEGNRWEAALAALRHARDLGDESAVTQLNLSLAEDHLGLDGRARMRALAKLCPGWDEPTLRLADSLRRAGEHALAMIEYERTLERNPNRPEALLSLAVLSLTGGDPERAQVLLLRGCGVAPRMAEVWDTLGLALLATNDAAIAESAFGQAQRLRPDDIAIAVRRIEASLAAGSTAGELARLEVATEQDPLDVAQLTARGVLLDRLGRSDEAADILETAVLLAPDAPMPAAAFAGSLLHVGRFNLAIPALRRAAELAPDNLSLQSDYAASLNRGHRYREGQEILERLLAEHGEQPAILCNLCNSLVSLGFQREGIAMARRATEAFPEAHLAWRTLSGALSYCDGIGAAEVLEACRRTGATTPRPPLAAIDPRTVGAPAPTEDDRRLRVGLLSPNLRTHPVGWLTVAAFEALDPAEFDLVCFAQAPSDDAVSRRFRAASSAWHRVIGQSHAAIARTVREAGIDILIDLGGWGDQGALPACALRPAPVQIKWVGGQFHSSGLAEMDWFISDRWETPEGCEHLYSERLLRLPDGYVCYSAPPNAPAVGPLPAEASSAVTFGCFNNLAKITPPTIAAWSRVLARVPGSRLVLKTHQFTDPVTCDRVRGAFVGHGIDAARIEPRGSSTLRSHLLHHGDIDIVLDPFPYAGGLTTCEALWMGVPVLTLPGETFASRHSASHLSNVGLPEWIAPDVDAYVEIAVARARDLAALRRLRAELRPRLKASPLCDAPRFAANLSAALRHAWHHRAPLPGHAP